MSNQLFFLARHALTSFQLPRSCCRSSITIAFRTMAATSTERVKKHRANKEAKKRSSTMETPPPKQEAPDALTALLQLCTSPLMASNIPAQVKLLSACTSLKLRQETSKKWDDDMKGLVSMLTQSTPESSNHRLSFAKKSPENINSEVLEASVVETVDSDDDYKPKAKRRRDN